MNAIGFKTISILTYWFTRLIFATLLFFSFTLIGGVVFGIFPALTGLFTMTRHWRYAILSDVQQPVTSITHSAVVDKDTSKVSTFSLYWSIFRREFITANIVGWSLTIIGLILVVDLHGCLVSKALVYHLALVPSIIILVIYLMIFLYVFPVISHYQTSPVQYIRISFSLAVSQPLTSLGLVIVVSSYVLLLRGLLPILGISLIAFGVTWVVQRAISRVKAQ